MHSLGSGYRFGCSYWWKHWLDPRTYYYYVKYKIQRANRGWANCDTWSLDNYLAEWLPDALRHLKKHKHGIPCGMFTDADHGPDGNATDEGMINAEKRWDDVMDKMIDAFVAYNRMTDGLYEDELGPYPLREDFWENINNPSEEERVRFNKSQELTKRDEKIFEEGAELFIRHFGSLWD